jgi:hypothetical protein
LYFFLLAEVTVVGSLSLSQKLKSMGKKSDALYNSKLHSSMSAFKSLSKTRGYPCPSPNSFGGSSSKSDFKLSDSSTGGKVPIHGPRRAVFPSRIMSDEFDIVRVTFKVNKSQIMNYKAICNLAMSRDSGYVFHFFIFFFFCSSYFFVYIHSICYVL